MGLGSWIIKKGVWYALSIAAVLGVGSFFNVLPQSLKDLIAWFGNNATELLVVVCVLVVCFTVLKATDPKRGMNRE